MARLLVPAGFTDLATVSRGPADRIYDVFGMVSDSKEPMETRSGKLTCTFELIDATNYNSGAFGLTVRFFDHRTYGDIPQPLKVGDVIMLRHIKANPWNGRMQLENIPGQTEWCIYHHRGIPVNDFKLGFMGGKQALSMTKSKRHKPAKEKMPVQEIEYIVQLRTMQSTFAGYHPSLQLGGAQQTDGVRISAEKRPASGIDINNDRRKMQKSAPVQVLMSDIEAGRYFHMTVKVIKKYDRNNGECELFVTDFTSNKELTYYPPPEVRDTRAIGRPDEPYGFQFDLKNEWLGPYGQVVLRTIARPPHGPWANDNVGVGEIICMRNLKITSDQHGALEGTLWEDRRYPEKIQIFKPQKGHVELVDGVQQREREYEAERKKKEGSSAAELSRNAKNKQKKRAKQEEKRRAAEEALLNARQQGIDQETAGNTGPELTINTSIICSHQDVPLSSLDEVLDADDSRRHTAYTTTRNIPYAVPFVNANFRARVRVVDFKPDKLEDFTIEVPDPYSQDLSRQELKWAWNFRLKVRDSNGTDLVLDVGPKQAEFLLGASFPEAADLKRDRGLLKKLQNTLWILWGDLEEQKADYRQDIEPANIPFECCIAEYGLLKEGGTFANPEHWTREFYMHGVTIR